RERRIVCQVFGGPHEHVAGRCSGRRTTRAPPGRADGALVRSAACCDPRSPTEGPPCSERLPGSAPCAACWARPPPPPPPPARPAPPAPPPAPPPPLPGGAGGPDAAVLDPQGHLPAAGRPAPLRHRRRRLAASLYQHRRPLRRVRERRAEPCARRDGRGRD